MKTLISLFVALLLTPLALAADIPATQPPLNLSKTSPGACLMLPSFSASTAPMTPPSPC